MNRPLTIVGACGSLTLVGVACAVLLSTTLERWLSVPSFRSVPSFNVGSLERPIETTTTAPTFVPQTRPDLVRDIRCRSLMDSRLADGVCSDVEEPKVSSDGCQDLSVSLVGTLVAEPATYSSALILIDGQAEAIGVGLGQQVDGLTIDEIKPTRVHTDRGWLCVDEADTPAPVARTTKPSAADGINQLGEYAFEISSELIDHHLANVGGLMGMAFASPNRGPNNQVDGYKLSRIRKGTLPDQLGIRNGDVVHGVNGMPLTSLQGATAALDALQSSDQFEVEITRRGQKQTLRYTKN